MGTSNVFSATFYRKALNWSCLLFSFAAIAHSNRCVSVINTGSMKKITDIEYNERTVWTIAIHPVDSRFIATGNMGGQVAVFKNFVSCYGVRL